MFVGHALSEIRKPLAVIILSLDYHRHTFVKDRLERHLSVVVQVLGSVVAGSAMDEMCKVDLEQMLCIHSCSAVFIGQSESNETSRE